MANQIPTLNAQIASIVSAMGCELWGCELVPAGRKRLLRVYIDKPNGVTVDDCSTISRQVSAMLDVEDPIQGEYILEVSSPGIDRPLFQLDQYRHYIGQVIKVKTRLAIQQRKQFKGVLAKIEQASLFVVVEGEQEATEIAFDLVEKASLVANINF